MSSAKFTPALTYPGDLDARPATPGETRPRWAVGLDDKHSAVLCDICDEYGNKDTCRLFVASLRGPLLILCNTCFTAAFKTADVNLYTAPPSLSEVEVVARAMFELKLEERGLT